jgi:hypothetical protein
MLLSRSRGVFFRRFRWRRIGPVLLEFAPRRGTEAVITAPTRNRMVRESGHVGSNPTLSATSSSSSSSRSFPQRLSHDSRVVDDHRPDPAHPAIDAPSRSAVAVQPLRPRTFRRPASLTSERRRIAPGCRGTSSASWRLLSPSRERLREPRSEGYRRCRAVFPNGRRGTIPPAAVARSAWRPPPAWFRDRSRSSRS